MLAMDESGFDAGAEAFLQGLSHDLGFDVYTAKEPSGSAPDVILLTTPTSRHIDLFSNAFNGHVVINHDTPHLLRLTEAAKKSGAANVIVFGDDEELESKLIDCALHADSSKVTVEIMKERVKYKLTVPGKHLVMDSLGVLTAVKILGLPIHKAAEQLKNIRPLEAAGNIFKVVIAEGLSPVTIIDESAHATPDTIKIAFDILEKTEPADGGRRIAVLGDMIELGKDGPRIHAELANPLLKSRVDLLFCCGPLMDALFQALPDPWRGAHTKDSRLLIEKIIPALKPGDVVLITGSISSKMAYVTEALSGLNNKKETRHVI